MADETTPTRHNRKTRDGVVISNKMDQTAVVAIIERVRHPKYEKFVNRTKKLYAHDETNDVNVGDRVRVSVVTEDEQNTALAASHVQALKASLAETGWVTDEVSYETRTVDERTGAVSYWKQSLEVNADQPRIAALVKEYTNNRLFP